MTTEISPSTLSHGQGPKGNSSLLKGLLLRIALPGILTLALLIASAFGYFIPLLEESMMQGRKDTARELANTVVTLLESYAGQVPEQATLESAQASAIEHIRKLRYGAQGKDYFWINDMTPVMIMHPYHAELEGTDVSDYQDPNGKNLFLAFVETIRKNKSGYVDYQWWWQDSERIEDKVSFIQEFEPWGWIVGTGLYLDDVTAEIAHLKNSMVIASSFLVVIVGVMVFFMTRQRYLAEKNRAIAEMTLLQSEQKFRGIFHNASHFAGILDSNGVLLEVNETAITAIGQSRQDVLGLPLEDTPWWQGSEENIDRLRKALKMCQDGMRVSEVFELKFDSDRAITLIFTANPIFNEAGMVERILIEGVDITERRELEEQLRQSQKMEAIGQLAGGIAHDFNNLLGGIIGNADLILESGKLQGEDRDCLEEILVASNRSADLTRQLLSFSRKGQFQNTTINLNDLIKEVVKLLSRSIDRRIKITQKLASRHPLVEGDPSMLQNALLNLGVNARDAMGHFDTEMGVNHELTFLTSEVFLDDESAASGVDSLAAGWYVQVQVRDTGSGMSPEIMEKAFEPFFTTKEEGKGTGLGLASAFGCIKAHRGSLAVDSEPNRGTTFTILLPQSLEMEQKPPEEEVHVSWAGGKILLVDDDEILRKVMGKVLGRLGYQCHSCCDGIEAVQYYEENFHSIDLIILDLIMPRMGGEVAFHRLMEINPQAKILISSGFSQNHTVDELIKQGACGFLGKPFQMAFLSRALTTHITAGKGA